MRQWIDAVSPNPSIIVFMSGHWFVIHVFEIDDFISHCAADSILGSAFLFGLFHGNLLQTPYAFLVGLVLGYVAVEYSVGWSMALHIFNNLVLADLLSRLTANLSEVAASVLELTIFTGFFVAAVAILIANRARVRA